MIHWKLKYLIVSISLITMVSAYDPVNAFLFPARSDFHIEDFTGAYFLGEGLGIAKTFVINDDWTFEVKIVSERESYPTAVGLMRVDADRIYLNDDAEVTNIEYIIPVQWGDRRYLIPYFSFETEDAVEGFCRRVENEEEPRDKRHGWVYLQNGQWDWPTDGLPITPWGAQLCSN
jgi:hypothetical protein